MATIADRIRGMYDTIENLASGLMSSKDKLKHTTFITRAIDREQIDAMYRNDWIAHKAVDIIPEDMTRAWRSWQADEKQITKIEETERKFRLRQKIKLANQMARLYGWAAILIGDGSNNPETPLDVERIQADGLKYLHVLHRHMMTFNELDRDIGSPDFMKPLRFELLGKFSRVRVHPSRLVMFVPHPNPALDLDEQTLGDSTIQVMYDAVSQAQSSAANIASLIFEAKVDVVKVPDLASQLSTVDGTNALRKRFILADQMKSNINMLLLGSEEEYDRKQTTFSGLNEILREYMSIVSGAVDIPITRFLSQSPGGLNSTGDADIRNYYDHVSAEQENMLRPTIETLDEVIIRASLGSRPDEIFYEWNPLWQMTEKERAEIGKTNAETSKIYASAGLIDDRVLVRGVQNQVIESGLYPGIELDFEEVEEEEGGLDAQLTQTDLPEDPNAPPGSKSSGVPGAPEPEETD